METAVKSKAATTTTTTTTTTTNPQEEIKMKPLGFMKHLFCYITLGLLCGWYFFILLIVPLLSYLAFYGSWIARGILTALIILTVLPLDHEPKISFIKSFLFKYWCEYFEVTYDNTTISGENALKQGEKYLFLEFPHGIFPMGQVLSLYKVDEAIPNQMICGIGADAIFTFPIMRQFMAWLGTVPANRKNIKKLFDQGKQVAVIPGGIAEMFIVNQEKESIYFMKRQNTIKTAIQQGANIVPLFFFGNTKLFKVAGQSGSDSFLSRMSRKFKTSVIFFYGRHFLPFCPFRHPIKFATGDVVRVEQKDDPTDEEVKEVQQRVVASVHKLYNERKPAWETRPLEIL